MVLDGAPFVEETTASQVRFLDLSVPIYRLPEYTRVFSIGNGRAHTQAVRGHLCGQLGATWREKALS